MTRSTNSFKNMVALYGSQLLTIILNFLTRTVFIQILGEEYLGVNGLFSNLLTMLSLAELGIGTAIVFKLYKPIEEHNEGRIIALMKLYKRIYTIIGWIVATLGLLCIPFLPYIVEDYETFARLNLNPVLILLMYIFNSASSYWFFAYKQTIVRAHQKTYLMTIWGYAIYIVSAISQIIILYTTQSFILYTMTMIAFNVLRNFVFAWIANKKYPYLKKKTDEAIAKAEIKNLFKDCGALFLYKMNKVVINATDSIVISVICGLSSVGIYSNYHMLFMNIRNLMMTLFDSIEASIGSINATGNMEWKRTIFRGVNFAAVILFGCVGIALAIMGDEFIDLWLGADYVSKSFTFAGRTYSYSLPLLFGIEMLITGSTTFLDRFRNAFGLFRQLKFRPVLGMIINLVIGVTLTPIVGLAGPVIGTIVANISTIMIFDPIVIMKHGLHIPYRNYFLKNALYYLVTLIAGGLAWFVCSLLPSGTVFLFILRGCTCVAVSAIVYLIAFGRSREMRILLSFLPEKFRKFTHN